MVGSSCSTRSGDRQQSYFRRLLNEDDSGSEADAPLRQKGLKRAHVPDESSGNEGKGSVDGSSSTTDVPRKKKASIRVKRMPYHFQTLSYSPNTTVLRSRQD